QLVSSAPTGLSSAADPDTVVCARQADVVLDRLLTSLLAARTDMRAELRIRPPDTRRQEVTRERLLGSLEAYTAALAARGLSAPPSLRDELALQRNLAQH